MEDRTERTIAQKDCVYRGREVVRRPKKKTNEEVSELFLLLHCNRQTFTSINCIALCDCLNPRRMNRIFFVHWDVCENSQYTIVALLVFRNKHTHSIVVFFGLTQLWYGPAAVATTTTTTTL